MSDRPSRVEAAAFATAVFLAAFLLFLVQPIVGKSLLPRFGGAPAVWTTCLLAFQSLLLAGYAWAHGLALCCRPRTQSVAQAGLLALALVFPVLPGDTVASGGASGPVARIVALVLLTVGVPLVALSATSPILQAWHARLWPAATPYRLYALSNAGSFLALVLYPFVVEPALSLDAQATAWRGALALLVVVIGWCAWRASRGRTSLGSKPLAAAVTRRIGALRALLWVAWSACGVMLFMAVTQQLTIDVAAVPFLWIVPLGVYLVTLVVTFSGPRAYPRRTATLLLPVALAALYLAVVKGISLGGDTLGQLSFGSIVLALTSGLFVACLVCHGELYRLRPPPERTTAFYLAIAFGGALGGAVVAVVAPAAFRVSEELHIAMVLCFALTGATHLIESRARQVGRAQTAMATVAFVAVLAGFVALLAHQSAALVREARFVKRNFFGVLRVLETLGDRPDTGYRRLYHGSTLHGLQDLAPDRRWIPTAYYTPYGGGGAVLTALERTHGRRVGLVGLGIGTLATYGRPGDTFRFYEIDPDVAAIAREWFTFLADSRAACEIVLGDARVLLEGEPGQGFDVLVLDAFSGDAVPVHLLTREAFALYDRHLAANGVIAAHISNRALDLTPVLYGLAEERGMLALNFQQLDTPAGSFVSKSSWMVLSRDAEFLKRLVAETKPLRDAGRVQIYRGDPSRFGRIPPWTDRSSNLWRILR